MSNNKYMGGPYPGGGGGGPYVTFINPNSYGGHGGDQTNMIQIHRGQTLGPDGGPVAQTSMEIGIDLPSGSLASLSPDLQSPGHDSVSSSVTVGSGASSGTGCRNSTTSTDSGRGSSISTGSVTRPTHTYGHQHRLSNVSSSQSSVCSSLGSSRQSHHSSSSSIQDRPEDRIFCLNIQEMINNGVADEDILLAWLSDLHFEEYFNLFISAGYDMPTISRMTPEDLTAIGIKNPAHRKKLKSEISKLSISDGIPNHVPGSLEEWLRLLRLEEYGPCLVSQGYSTVQEVATISIEDLEDTGFYRLGHQKRLTLGIRKLKELSRGQPQTIKPQQAGQARLPQSEYYPPHPQYIAQSQEIPVQAAPLAVKPGSFSSFTSPYPGRKMVSVEQHYSSSLYTQEQQQQYNRSLGPGQSGVRPGQYNDPPEIQSSIPEPMAPLQYPLYKQSLGVAPAHYPGSPRFTPRASGGLGHPPDPQSQYRMMRSYDDADIVRRSDNSILVHETPGSRGHVGGGGETLPRLKGSNNLKPKPVAKIIANTRSNIPINPDEIERDWDEKCDSSQEAIQICDNLCKSGTSSPNMTLRKNRSGSDAGLQPRGPTWPRQASYAQTPQIPSSPQMKRNSSFGSESGLPFANDNAGTIRIRSNSHIVLQDRRPQDSSPVGPGGQQQKRSAGDVLQDIGSMLSDLTDELDAMLKLEKDD